MQHRNRQSAIGLRRLLVIELADSRHPIADGRSDSAHLTRHALRLLRPLGAALYVQFDGPEGGLVALEGRQKRPTEALGRVEVRDEALRHLHFLLTLDE